MLATLGRERILRSVDGAAVSGDKRYEIFHDVLADAVLAWRPTGVSSESGRRPSGGTAGCSASRADRSLRLRSCRPSPCTRSSSATASAFAPAEAAAREYEAGALLGLQSGADNSLALALRAAELEPDARAETVLREA